MRFLVFLSFLVFTACSMVKTAPNRLVIEKRWVRNTPAETYLGNRRIHRFTPVILDKLVIVGNAIDGVVAYDRNTASEKWRLKIKDGVEGGAFYNEDVLYFGASDGQLYAVQADSGQVLWTYPLKAEGLAKPLVKNGVLYILGGNNVAHAIDAKTGKLLWIYNRREASNISVRGGSQPALIGDLVLVGFSDGNLVGLNKSSGAVVWEANLNHNKRFRDVDATPIVDETTAYVSSYDGGLYAVNGTDGRILWTIDDGGFDAVALSGNALFYSSTAGKTYSIDKKSGKVLWTKENAGGIATGPVLYKGTVIVGELDGALRFYDMRSGDALNDFEPGRGVTSIVGTDAKSGQVYFISHDANIYALEVDWKHFAKDWPWE